METVSRFLQVPERSFFLFGPRGTGKTTWIHENLRDALVLDLLRPELYRELRAKPERLRERMEARPSTTTIVLDEIQRIPELLTVVHDLIERNKPLRFVLTGSSSRKLRRGGFDLLAGRAVMRTLHPFMAAELPSFHLDRAVTRGLVPIVVAAGDPADVLNAYATLYLEEEIRLEGWTRNIGDFARFLEAASFSHASVLNISNVSRECHVSRKTVEGYFEILEDLLLAFRLPVFTRRVKRRITQHPKFYFFDAGIYRSLRPSGPMDQPETIAGATLEGLTAQHLRAWIAYRDTPCDLFFWRTPAGTEVDFILYGPDTFCAIEVKHTDRVRPEDLRPLKRFHEDYPGAERFFLYRGGESLKIDGILCLPVDHFLPSLHPRRKIEHATF